MMRVADYIMLRLENLGIRQIFFLPGGGAMYLNDALALNKNLEGVLCLHEQACGVAAEAAAKITNGPSACLVTSGPGSTNAVTATLGAWLDSTPVFFLSGQVKSTDLKGESELRMLGNQEADIVSIVKPITKMAITLKNAKDVVAVFDKLEMAALTGRRGPVWLDVPLDIQSQEIHTEQSFLETKEKVPRSEMMQINKIEIEKIFQILQKAKRPVIVAGNGIRMGGADKIFIDLVEKLNIPVQTSWLSLDLIEDTHCLYAGRPGSLAPRWANFTLQNSDCVIILGCRLDQAMVAYSHERFARGALKVIVDIDPSEVKKLKMDFSVSVIGEVGIFIEAMSKELDRIGFNKSYPDWLYQIQSWKSQYPLIQKNEIKKLGPVSLYHFTDCISDLMSEGDIISCTSAGFTAELFLLNIRIKKFQRCLHNRGTGSMGFALPAAVGACTAAKRMRTICIDGDGSFQMNMQELATVVGLNLPIKCFVISNQGYASIRSSQKNYFNRLLGADSKSGMFLPNLKVLAEAYSIPYFRIENEEKLCENINYVINFDGPILCEVIAIPEEPRIPRVSTKKTEEGKLVSSPLEDMFPYLDRIELEKNMYIPLIDE
jgi:acetolactate synthase-1/2/3 large subunit